MKTDQPLKPCPFCGKPPSTSTYYIECDGCDIYFDWFHGKREDVIAKWNTRADKHGDKERVLEIIEEQERQWRLSNYEWSAACIRLRDLITAALSTSTPPSSTDGKCSLCGSSRVPLNREGTKFGACVFPECKDSMHDYNAEQSTDGKTEGKVWSEQIAISDCCGAPTASRDNMKHNGEELVCVGTYRVCEKCRMACDYHWMNPPQTTNTEER